MTAEAGEVTEQITIDAAPGEVFAAVADMRRMARWSPECFAVWIWRSRDGLPHRFVGWNRRKGFVWFTTCRVVVAKPGEEFAFDVTTFGSRCRAGVIASSRPMAAARWSPSIGTIAAIGWLSLSGVFTGAVATRRGEANRAGMRATLRRRKSDLG